MLQTEFPCPQDCPLCGGLGGIAEYRLQKDPKGRKLWVAHELLSDSHPVLVCPMAQVRELEDRLRKVNDLYDAHQKVSNDYQASLKSELQVTQKGQDAAEERFRMLNEAIGIRADCLLQHGPLCNCGTEKFVETMAKINAMLAEETAAYTAATVETKPTMESQEKPS